MKLFSWNLPSVRTKGTNFKAKLRNIRGFWRDKYFIKVWDLTKICSWLKFYVGTPWHYVDMDFSNNFQNQFFGLHVCLCTPKNTGFLDMWVLNANLNCIFTQNLRECKNFFTLCSVTYNPVHTEFFCFTMYFSATTHHCIILVPPVQHSAALACIKLNIVSFICGYLVNVQ